MNVPLNSTPSNLDNDFGDRLEEMRRELQSGDKSVMDRKTELGPGLSDGIFEETIDGDVFTCLFIGCPKSKKLYVSFRGADSRYRDPVRKPHFPRWSYHKFIGADLLCIDDPMLVAYPHLRIGWYYGTKDRTCISGALEIVRRVCEIRKIKHRDVVFFSSSGGGYAAMLAASMMPGTLSISINPQIILKNYPLSNLFEERTGVDLLADDPLGRHDLSGWVRKTRQSKHMVCVNALSHRDWDVQAVPFAKAVGMTDLKYGLNCRDNVLIWVYDAPGVGDPHVSFETKSIFTAMQAVGEDFMSAKNFNMQRWSPVVGWINEAWHDIFAERHARREAEVEAAGLQEKLDGLRRSFAAASGLRLGYERRRIPVGGDQGNFNYFRYDAPASFSKGSIVVKCSSPDTKLFTAGFYDFAGKRIVEFRRCRTGALHSFAIPETGDKIAFLVYAGPAGRTAGKSLTIDTFQAWRPAAAAPAAPAAPAKAPAEA